MSDDSVEKTAEESIRDAKRAIVGTRATLPIMLKTVEDIRDNAAELAKMLASWVEASSTMEFNDLQSVQKQLDLGTGFKHE